MKELTTEDKAKILKENGWYQLWSEDNWLERDKSYTNIDWAGLSTKEAFEKYLENKELASILHQDNY